MLVGFRDKVNNITQQHYCENGSVSIQHRPPCRTVKIGKDLADDDPRIVKRRCFEKDPAETNEMKRKKYTEKFQHFALGNTKNRHADFVERERHAMHSAPDNKIEGCAMPQTADKHREH